MKTKRDKGIAGIDMIISITAITIFSAFILSLMVNNSMENLKIARETMAMIYITEVFEKVGIADYDAVLEENKDDFIPQEALENYKVEMKVENIENQEQDILKKVSVTLTYEITNKTYSYSMERLKSKE